MNSIIDSLFKPNAVVVIRLEGDVTVQGTVIGTDKDGIRIIKEDQNVEMLGTETLSKALYCYVGFPTIREKVVPLTVKGNGAVLSFREGSGFVVSDINTRYVIRESSFLDPQSLNDATNGEFTGKRVLYVIPENQTQPPFIASVIKAGPLDEVLDKISILAKQGKTRLALDFCSLVQLEYPSDPDVSRFGEMLREAELKAKSLDFYTEFPLPSKGELEPFGRIYEVNKDNGYIIDVISHKKLFFFKAQLMGGLEYKKPQELIGMPVLYSVKEGNRPGDFQARTILPPMHYTQAYDIAEDLHFSPDQMLSACDILRLILEQYSNPDYEADLAAWMRNKSVQDRLWPGVVLDEYQGPTETLFRPLRAEDKRLTLKRELDHTRTVMDMDGTPEFPTILFSQEMAELKASVPKPGPTPEPVTAPSPERTEVQPSEPVETEPENVPEENPISQLQSLPSLAQCDRADQVLKPKASITVRFRKGSLFVEGEQAPYSFRMVDIIDEELKNRAMMLSTKAMQDEPVVCLLSYSDHKATYICSPKTVREMLVAATDAIVSARSKDPKKERDEIFSLYDSAKGFASCVIDQFNDHTEANLLMSIAEEGLRKFGRYHYRAPFNAVKTCGTIRYVNNGKLRVKDPLFTIYLQLDSVDIIDRDYKNPRIGDELVYSVFPPKEEGIRMPPVIRFACLARPASELALMAESWEKEGDFEKAWGIAMSILDAEPDHQEALAIAKRCEPKVSPDIVKDRRRIFREDLFAAGQIAAADGHYQEAISLFTRIVDSQDENTTQKNQSVLRLLHLYSVLLSKDPDNQELKEAYRDAGHKYVLGIGSSFSLQKTMEVADAVIQFHEDMGDKDRLLKAYKEKRNMLVRSQVKIADAEERSAAIAQVNANIAWYTLISGGDAEEAENYARWAKEVNNDLGRVCDAIIQARRGQGEKEILEKASFPRQNIDVLEEMFAREYAGKIYSGRGEMKKNLTFERFALLCAIVQEKNHPSNPSRTLHYLWRYLATLTSNEAEYRTVVSSSRGVPDDCLFVRQVFKCLQFGAGWRGWMDVRLISMLSEDAALRLCNTLFDLDPSTFTSVLVRSEIECYSNPQRGYFAQRFGQWRGAAFQSRYVTVLGKVDTLENDIDLEKCIAFFREFEFESWMVRDDMELVSEFHWQMPGLLTSFLAAENSRAIKTTSRSIVDSINNWNKRIGDRPTVLMQCALVRLLLQIRKEVSNREEAHHYSKPEPIATLLSVSALGAERSMFMEVEIRNKDKNAEPMNDCSLRMDWIPGIIPDAQSPVVTYSETNRVYGDESIVYILHFRLTPDIDLSDLKMVLHFNYKVKTVEMEKEFTFNFKPEQPQEEIANDYNLGAIEYKRFYGRKAYIQKVITVLSDPQQISHFFIYGQKRCGKSSVLIQIQKQIESKIPEAIIAKVDFLGLELTDERDIYHIILKRFLQSVTRRNYKVKNNLGKKPLDPALLVIPNKDEVNRELLITRLNELKDAFQDTPGWENCRLVLFVDEFTTAYRWLIDGLIKRDFMHRWKTLQTEGLFNAVLVGQDVLHDFMKETEGPNAFEVLEKKRLNYLEPEEARRLATEPIEESTRRNDVFIGNAVDRILYYSASSAYYTKWVCSSLVDFLNARMLYHATSADVDAAVWNAMRTTAPVIVKALFDPLVFPGITSERESRFSSSQTKTVLDVVAEAELMDPVRGCSKADLMAKSEETRDDIIRDLVERGVMEENHGFYKIRVKLYLVWYQVRNNLEVF